MRLKDLGLYVAWLIAVIATLGSLYFSEVRNFIPCTLCWYQRILMYPLVILLGIASYRRDTGIIRYVLPMTVLGVLFAGYHYMLEKIPGFAGPTLCRVGIPCDYEWINWLGFITIPFLSLVAFTLITATLIGTLKSDRTA